MVLRENAFLDSSPNDGHDASLKNSYLPASNEHLLSEWLLPSAARAQASVGTGKQAAASTREQASVRTTGEQATAGTGEQSPASVKEPEGSAFDRIDPRRFSTERARELEIVKVDNEMKAAMEAISDGAILMAQFLGQIRVEPGIDGLAPGVEQLQPTPIWKKVSDLFQTMPSNTQCTPERYPEVFGEDVAGLLSSMSVERVSHWVTPDGKHHYSLEFDKKKTHVFKAAEMTHEEGIQFEVALGPDGIRLDQFQGLKVKKTDGTFTATIDRVMIKPEGENVVIEGQGHWFFFKGSKRLVLGPDGKPLPEKKEPKQ